MKKIILLNGPPRAGKDTLGEMYKNKEYFTKVEKFAGPIKAAATAIYCGGNRGLFDSYDTPALKDTPQPIFMGKTCREVQIAISENFLKPYHGQDIFGRLMVERLKLVDPITVVVITDSGFMEEAESLVKQFGVDKVFLVRLHRDGYDFSNDSRNYINLDHLGVPSIDITNVEGQQESTLDQIYAFVLGDQ